MQIEPRRIRAPTVTRNQFFQTRENKEEGGFYGQETGSWFAKVNLIICIIQSNIINFFL